ncbi:type 1 fimbrae adaptor subunit FimG [Enterobacter cloacae]|nr:type 1 fimbrae adaptor subunit FimG [Enterobacter cloacae]
MMNDTPVSRGTKVITMLRPGLIITLFLSLFSVFVQADPTVSVSGQVVASPCTVDTNTVNKTVDLGMLQRRDLVTAGSAGDWSDFDLVLTNCPSGTTSVTALLSGTADSQDTTAWKNNGTSGNLALRITSRDHSVIYSAGNSLSRSVDVSTNSVTFPLSARIFTPLGNATVGTYNTVMNVDFTWQ